jgi:hypothetical protein
VTILHHRRYASCARLVFVFGVLLTVLLAGRTPAGAQEPAPGVAQSEGTTIYLPMLRGSGQTQPPPTQPTEPTVPPVTPVPGNSGAFFFSNEVKTNDADMAVDNNGGVHVAFKTFVSGVEHPTAYYGYCASACASDAGWSYVSFGDQVDEVELDLTADGKPRVLVRWTMESSTNDEYVYFECDANCTGEGTWNGVIVLKGSIGHVFEKDNPQRAFAIDPQGRPRFVYTNAWGAGKPEGVYYVHCDSSCADPNQAQWFETRITPDEQYKSETMDFPSLAFTSDGRPRVAGVLGLSGDAYGLHYLACDEGCDDLSGWSSVFLGERGGGAYAGWDLEIDGQDRPRVAQYQGGLEAGDPGRLFYLSCDGGCLDQGAWRRTAIAAPGVGINPDLELSANGSPRIAHGNMPTAGDLLGYTWCDGGCEGDAGQWRQRSVETSAALDAVFKPDIPLACKDQAWLEAIPSLDLDANGNPRINYDALNVAMCYYDLGPGNGTGYRAEKIWRAARYVYFAQ